MEEEKMMNTQRIGIALGLATVILASMMAPAYAQGSATLKIDQIGDLIVLTVNSDTDVAKYQIIVTADQKPLLLTVSGFVKPSITFSNSNEHRWFGLTQSGKLGQIAFITFGCITIKKVQLSDSTYDPTAYTERITLTGTPLPYRSC